MAKKKQQDDLLTFTPRKPEVGIRKNAENINAPTFRVVDSPCKADLFCEIRLTIENLEIGKRLEVSNENTGFNMYDFKLKIRNIVFAHQRKYVEKKFTTEQINKTTIAIDRQKNIII